MRKCSVTPVTVTLPHVLVILLVMGIVKCVCCDNRRTPGCGISFHHFPPSNNTQLKRRWEINTKIDNFVANKNDVPCDHHFTADSYVFPGSKKLKYEAIPTVFNFPSTSSFYQDSPKVPRKPPCKRSYPLPPETSACMITKIPKLSCNVQSPTKEELNRVIGERIKRLQSSSRK